MTDDLLAPLAVPGAHLHSAALFGAIGTPGTAHHYEWAIRSHTPADDGVLRYACTVERIASPVVLVAREGGYATIADAFRAILARVSADLLALDSPAGNT